MAILKKPIASKPAATSAKPSVAAVDPFAERFNTAASNPDSVGFTPLPVGAWEALAVQGGILKKDGKESAWIDYVISEEGPHQGMKGRCFFGLKDVDGELLSGIDYLGRDLSNLGYVSPSEGIKSYDEIEDILASIEETPCWVIIRVQKSGKYTNIQLDSVKSNQEDKPEIPI